MIFFDRKGNKVEKPRGVKAKKRSSAYGVYMADGKLLVVKPVKSEKWELPGGGIGKGETACKALAREFMEETGYKILKVGKEPFKIGKDNFCSDSGSFYLSELSFFRIEAVSRRSRGIIDTGEIREARLISLSGLTKENSNRIHWGAIRQIKEGRKQGRITNAALKAL